MKTAIHHLETRYGFEYGSCRVERMCSDEKKGWVILNVFTPKVKDGVQIYVTKTGKIRVYAKGGEWLPKKS